jgi:hypothetical protein
MRTDYEQNILTGKDIPEFVFAGNSTFTLSGNGVRATYRVVLSSDEKVFFVRYLSGPDNESSYSYLGHVSKRDRQFFLGKKMTAESVSAQLFIKLFESFKARTESGLTVWHHGRCGRCGRLLTVPESIAAGIGPDCAHIMAQKHSR